MSNQGFITWVMRKFFIKRCCDTCQMFRYEMGVCLDHAGPFCDVAIPREFRKTWHCRRWR